MRICEEILMLPEEKHIKPERALLTETAAGILHARAVEEGVSRGEIVRRAVHDYLGLEEPAVRYKTVARPNKTEQI